MNTTSKIIRFLGGVLAAIMLLVPPYKYTVVMKDRTIEGLYGHYVLWAQPDNPVMIMKHIRATYDGTIPPFDHRTDYVRLELDPLRLVLQLAALFGAVMLALFLVRKMEKPREKSPANA
jgi:hypothetical protein